MMNYIHITLWLVFLYDVLVALLLPSTVMFSLGTDGSAARMISTVCAFGIGAFAIYNYGLGKLTNKWILFFLLFIIFSAFHGPNIDVDSIIIPKDSGIYNFKPLFECCLYLLMLMGMISMPLTETQYKKINLTLCWIGIVSSVYVVFQFFGWDQMYKLTDSMHLDEMTRHPKMGGFIGQPVFEAALLAMCLPYVCKHKVWFTPLVLIAIVLTGNRSALIAVLIMVIWLCSFKLGRKYTFMAIGAYIAILALITAIYWVNPHLVSWFDSNGRCITWKMMITDFFHHAFPGINKCYILTGTGIGSFNTLFPFYNNSRFFQAHNEFIEVFYTCSFAGLFLFIMMVRDVFQNLKDDYIFLSLTAIFICALTNPLWHIPQLQFLTVFLVGLAYNKNIGAHHVQ